MPRSPCRKLPARRSVHLAGLTLAQTALGSSLNYTSTASFDNFDILSSDASRNPDFHDWTGVYIKSAAAAWLARRRISQLLNSCICQVLRQ